MAEKYFLGCMTENGFSTGLGELVRSTDCFTYILKGGPGTGKSTLMKRIAEKFSDREEAVRFYCSSDPESLDAVLLKEAGVMIVDGTSPHVFDPEYPGCCQTIVDLGQCWDIKKLEKSKEGIIDASDRNHSLHARAKRFNTALTNICCDIVKCAGQCIDESKLEKFKEKFLSQIIRKEGSGTGRRTFRQLSCLTELGYHTWTETLADYADVYVLKDDIFAASRRIISELSEKACELGYDVILSPAQVFNNMVCEHILIPELGTAVVSCNFLNRTEAENAKRIDLGRFYEKNALAPFRNRLKMDRMTAKQLSEEVYKTIRSAKEIHDELEEHYIKAMDFKRLDKAFESISKSIEKRYS